MENLTINNILATKQSSKAMGGVQAQMSMNVLKNIIGPEGLPDKLLNLINTSANSVQSIQAQAQSQLKSGHIDIKV